MNDNIDLGEMVREKMDEALKKRGNVNILICGKTGVGKSTLINAVFQGNLATTGQGRPVSQGVKEITKKGIPVSLFDTKGIEVMDHEQDIKQLKDLIIQRKFDDDPRNHIHVAWLCIAEDSRRVESVEINLVDELAQVIPVIGVITKSRSDAGFRDTVQDLLPSVRNVCRVRSIHETLDDGHTIEPMGLEDLVDLTMEVVPEGQQQAFAAAQKISLKKKRNSAIKVVSGSVAAAIAVAATPIPFSDAILLVPIQIGMLAGISVSYGLPLEEGFLGTLVSSTLGTSLMTAGGRALVSNMLKLIPGAGSLVGGAISASVASTLTATMGSAYIATLDKLLADDPTKQLSADEIAEQFKIRLKSSSLAPEKIIIR